MLSKWARRLKESNAMDWFHLLYIFWCWGSFVSFDLAEWHFWEVRLRLCPCTNLTECNVNEWSMCDARLWHLFFLYKCYIWPWSSCKYNVSDFDRKSCNYMCTVPKNTSIQDQFCYHFAVFVCTVKSVEGRRRQLLSKVVSTSKLPRASMITRHPTMKMATRQITGGKREREQICETLKKIFPASTFPRWLQRKRVERFAAST